MEIRHKVLSELDSFIKGVDQQVTIILQNLQWDRKRLLEVNIFYIAYYGTFSKIKINYYKTNRVCVTVEKLKLDFGIFRICY